MAITNSARLSFLGSLPRGERFAWSLWLTPNSTGTVPSTNTDAQTLLNNLMGLSKFQPIITAAVAYLGPSSAYETCQLYCYPNGGRVAAASGQKAITGGTGAGSSGFFPNQVSRVVTLRTNKLGRSYRGRVYLPCTIGSALNLGLFSNDATPLLQAFADYQSQLQLSTIAPVGGGLQIVVASSRVGAGTYVNAFSSDNRPDVQRRRANKMTGVTTVSIPIPVA